MVVLIFFLGKNSIFLITPLLGMAKVLGNIGRSTKAVETYNHTISILELSRGAESEDLVVVLYALGNLLLKEGRAADAETHFVRLISKYVCVCVCVFLAYCLD
jgi:tetratricopeptide (TPR) repeat protein